MTDMVECYRCGHEFDSIDMWCAGEGEYCESCFQKEHAEEWYTEKKAMSDPVHRPNHYRWLPVEAIEITELFNFNLGNALKYIIRADHKGKPIEDLEKARWYLDRELQRRAKQ